MEYRNNFRIGWVGRVILYPNAHACMCVGGNTKKSQPSQPEMAKPSERVAGIKKASQVSQKGVELFQQLSQASSLYLSNWKDAEALASYLLGDPEGADWTAERDMKAGKREAWLFSRYKEPDSSDAILLARATMTETEYAGAYELLMRDRSLLLDVKAYSPLAFLTFVDYKLKERGSPRRVEWRWQGNHQILFYVV
jgi:hypothetical protein